MVATFTEAEKNILYGQSPKLGNKHQVSGKYVKLIINGDRKVKSSKSKLIYKDLQDLIELLTPYTN